MPVGALPSALSHRSSPAAPRSRGQDIRTSVPMPSARADTSRSSTRPARSASPILAATSSSASRSGGAVSGSAGSDRNTSAVSFSSPFRGTPRVTIAPLAARSTTRTVNLSPSAIATATRSPSPCERCRATACEYAFPIASRTSSSNSSGTPARRATATPTSRAVRTCAAAGENDSRTVGMALRRGVLRVRAGRGGRGRDGVVKLEDPVQGGDPEDLEQPLVGADKLERSIDRPEPLQRTDQHPEAGRVQELHPAEIHHDVPGTLLDQVDEAFPQPRRGVAVDLAADFEHGVVARVVCRKRQLHADLLLRRCQVTGDG